MELKQHIYNLDSKYLIIISLIKNLFLEQILKMKKRI
jgi:hypothetical protein